MLPHSNFAWHFKLVFGWTVPLSASKNCSTKSNDAVWLLCNCRWVNEWFIYCALSLRRRILLVRRDNVFPSSLYWSLPRPLLPHPHHQSDHGSFRPVAGHTPIPTHTTTPSAATHLHGTGAGMLCVSWLLVLIAVSSCCAVTFVRFVCVMHCFKMDYCILNCINYCTWKLLILGRKPIIRVFSLVPQWAI